MGRAREWKNTVNRLHLSRHGPDILKDNEPPGSRAREFDPWNLPSKPARLPAQRRASGPKRRRVRAYRRRARRSNQTSRPPQHAWPSAFLERTAQPFAMFDFEGRFVRVNPAFEQLTGYTCGRGDGSHARRAHARDAGTRLGRRSATRCARPAPRRGTRRSIATRTAPWSRSRCWPSSIAIDQGEPSGFTAFVTDISQRKQVESALACLRGAVPAPLRRGPGRLPRDRHRGADRQYQPDRVRDARLHPRGDHRPARLRFRRAGVSREGTRGVPREDPRGPGAAHDRADVRDARRAPPVGRDRGAVQARRAGAGHRHPEHGAGYHREEADRGGAGGLGAAGPGPLRGDRRRRLRARPRRPDPRRQPRRRAACSATPARSCSR